MSALCLCGTKHVAFCFESDGKSLERLCPGVAGARFTDHCLGNRLDEGKSESSSPSRRLPQEKDLGRWTWADRIGSVDEIHSWSLVGCKGKR